MMETVLVTGGNGFVAGWCIRTLLQRGHAVRTTVRNPAVAPLLGRQFPLTSDKARRLLSFSPLPASATIVDCARSLLATSGS